MIMMPHIYQDQYSYITKFHFPKFDLRLSS